MSVLVTAFFAVVFHSLVVTTSNAITLSWSPVCMDPCRPRSCSWGPFCVLAGWCEKCL